MDKSTENLLIKGALIAGAVYLIYQLLAKGTNQLMTAAGDAAASLTAPVVDPLARLYVWLTSQGAELPQGQILLPDGQTLIPVASVNVRNVSGTNYGTFSYGGSTYYLLTGHDANGNYAASATLNG